MKKTVSLSVIFAVAGLMVVLPVIDGAFGSALFTSQVMAQEDDDDGRRAPPEARSSQTLGRRVYTRINEVMELRDMEQYVEALAILDEIKEDFDRDRLNDREKFVMWQFYASIHQVQENYDGAIEAYLQMLRLPNLTQEQIEQTMFYLGSLYYVQEQFPEAIDYYMQYNDIALEPNEDVYYRIGTAHYQLEQFQEAIPFILQNMEILRAKNEAVPKNTYDLLRALYFNVEDFQAAYQVLREMVVLYNEADDWVLLPAVLGQIDQFREQAFSYYVTYAQDFLDSDSQLINFAAQLYNNDYPYGCARVMKKGMDEGIIEEDAENLAFLSTCYQLAREDSLAAPPLARAATMSDDGEYYARLGRIYLNMSDFENAVEAFDNAIEKGGLDRPDQVYMSQAGAYLQLNRHDEGLAAARAAARDERSEDTARTWITILTRDKERYETLQRRRRELADFL